ncbi:hypothetical protein L210DRAFT_858009, partial [Boletus edulis BED1]
TFIFQICSGQAPTNQHLFCIKKAPTSMYLHCEGKIETIIHFHKTTKNTQQPTKVASM